MAWPEYYPVLTQEQVRTAIEQVTEEERREFEEQFGVSGIAGQQQGKPHILSVSLFFKNVLATEAEIGVVTEDVLRNPNKHGIACRYNPWAHYVEPILTWAPIIAAKWPHVTLRVYLASDLHFLVERLSKHCEVYIMRSTSTRAAPGMLWRYFAVEDASNCVTILDSDMLAVAGEKLLCTENLDRFKCSVWRCPVVSDWMDKRIGYRPMAGGYWGTKVRLPMRSLLLGFLWNLKRERLSKTGTHPKSLRVAEIFGANWPDYGADEFFLATTLYPRLAAEGTLTIVSHLGKSWFLPLDIEYATWLNGASCVDYTLFRQLVKPELVAQLSERTRIGRSTTQGNGGAENGGV